MTIIVPILIVSLLVGVFAKRMTPALWGLVAIVILVTLTHFYLKN